MFKREYVYVTRMGVLYKLTRRQWIDYLTAVALHQYPEIDKFGKEIATEVHNVTDLDQSDARDLLEELK